VVLTISVCRSSGGGVLDDMVLMSSYVACCVVHLDLLLGGHRILS
jgi:hypothetical protein